MTNTERHGTPLQNAVNGITGILIVLCGTEMTPGWGLIGLGWSPVVYCLITAVAGALSGWLSRTEYRLPGLVAGAIAGPGAILAVYLLLQKAERVPIPIVLIAICVGMLPALGIYKILTAIQDGTAPPSRKNSSDSRSIVQRRR
jgi:hypothetical protein